MAEEITKSMMNPDSVGLVFPLQTEVTIEISKIQEYAAQLSKLFAFYKKQLQVGGNEIKGYELSVEIPPLITFLIQLDLAIKASNLIKPVIASDPEKTSVFDYEFLTMRIIAPPYTAPAGPDIGIQINGPKVYEIREYSDGSKRETLIYNKIDFVYLQNKTLNRSMTVLTTLQIPLLTISPSTLALLFNSKQILDQINAPIPSSLLLCQGRETTLSKLEDGFSFLGFDVGGVTSKVLLKDFLSAYIQPLQEIVAAPKPPIPKGCTPEVKDRLGLVRSNLNMSEIQMAFSGGPNFVGLDIKKKYEQDKQEFIELTKICPDLISEINLFESIKDIDKLGKLFTNFLEKYNLACIVDEAIKCVMPQIPCDQILRDLTVDNFEQRLQTAFPHQKNIVHAITLNINEALEKENKRREDAGEQLLDPAGQTQLVLDNINKVIDLEALCKIDIEAIIELIKNLFNIKLPSFNLLDWQFNFKIDLNLAIIEALLKMLLSMIEQILNELVGCDALDGLIAGIINSNVDAPTGLYGDLAAMFNGDFDFSNLQGAAGAGVQNFLTQSGEQLSKIIVFESKLGNNLLGDFGVSGTLGFGKSADNILVGNVNTGLNAFGGLIRTSTYTSGSVGVAGFQVSPTSFTGTLDVTRLASTEKQLDFLKEIGQFQVTTDGTTTNAVRISDDSLVQLLNSSNDAQIIRTVPAVLQQGLEQDIYTPFGARNKNRHILKALVNVNQTTNLAQLIVPQGTLADQLKDYVKTCFALLSPSEVIDLITANSSLEVKLTITEIARIRFPLLNGILKYPERHALLFASFGKLAKLDSIGPRLQILSSDPTVKEKMVDPNVCAPFSNLRDFRESLMRQVLPQEVANKLMDDLVEDDRNRANNLLNNLAKKPPIADLMTNPAALSINKTPDGKQIQEIDRAIGNTLSNLFDQIKLSFDKEVEAYPNASSATLEESQHIKKYIDVTPKKVEGFIKPNDVKGTDRPVNQEYTNIYNSNNNKDGEPVEGDDNNFYYPKKVHKRKQGQLVYNVFDSIQSKFNLGSTTFTANSNGSLPQETEQSFSGIKEAGSLASGSYEFVPRWNVKYVETTGSYLLDIRTAGQIPVTSGDTIEYAERLKFAGSVMDENPGIANELRIAGLTTQEQFLTRNAIFEKIMIPAFKKISNIYYNIDGTIQSEDQYNAVLSTSILSIFRELASKNLIQPPYDAPLLQKAKASQLQDEINNILLSLVDFTPLPTEQEKACGVDIHLLQLEAVKKRVLHEFNSSIPENLVNKNSQINTRYSDSKPGHLSEKIMTGLAETLIRVCVIHNIFKGLFLFDKYNYRFDVFSIQEIIYMFFEHMIKSDIKKINFENDFQKEIEKIYNLYKKDEKQLIPENDSGSNKLRSIIKYHIDSVLGILRKVVNSYQNINSTAAPNVTSDTNTTNIFPGQIPDIGSQNTIDFRRGFRTRNEEPSIPLQTSVTLEIVNPGLLDSISAMYNERFDVPMNVDINASKNRVSFLKSLPVIEPYSNFYTRGTITSAISGPYGLYRNNINYAKFTSNTNTLLSDNQYGIIIQKYVKFDFKQTAVSHIQPQQYRVAKNFFANNQQLNGVVNLKNFEEIMFAILINIGNNSNKTTLYKKNATATEAEDFWFNSPPKFGYRICLVKNISDTEDVSLINNKLEVTDNKFYNGLLLDENIINFGQNVYRVSENPTRQATAVEINRTEKKGLIQNFEIVSDDVNRAGTAVTISSEILREKEAKPETKILKKNSINLLIPIIEKEIEFPEEMYNFDNTNLPSNFYNDYIAAALPHLEEIVKRKMLADPTYDILVNFCLMQGISKTISLMNSMVGMASEPMFKLLDGTKDLIRKNYEIQKNSGNFKTRDNKGAYEKQKKASQESPPAVDFLKAAATIPINMLKGLATAVDPNIFLADKIVLAGKMGFVQPKFKRVESGEIVKIEGSNQTKTITSEEAGVAYDGYYKYLETGELQIKANPTSQGSAITEFTIVALVDDETKKVKKDSDGKVVTRQGLNNGIPYSGVPYNVKQQSFIDSNFNDQEDVETFDIRPSTPIFPGEKINIPYSVASLLLMPFPIFGPSSLTTYNVAMPFGPLFLALEPLIFETPEFKASVPKKEEKTIKDQNGQVVCDDKKED